MYEFKTVPAYAHTHTQTHVSANFGDISSLFFVYGFSCCYLPKASATVAIAAG